VDKLKEYKREAFEVFKNAAHAAQMATILETSQDGLHSYYTSKIEELQIANRDKALNLERLKVSLYVMCVSCVFFWDAASADAPARPKAYGCGYAACCSFGDCC